LLLTPIGERIVYYFTTVDEGSYTYRTRLFEIAIDAIIRDPLFGSYDYIYSPAFQELKQGQGIIDIVNTYIAIALGSGLAGLGFFVFFFAIVIWGVWRQMKTVVEQNCKAYDIGRSLFAALICILVTIGTVSSITVVPVIYYLIAGLGVAYARWIRSISHETLRGGRHAMATAAGANPTTLASL
jgi:O-antigen ligase